MSWLDPFLFGRNAYGVLAAGFIQPSVNGTVVATTDGTRWLVVGMHLYVGNGGAYEVTSIPDSTHVTMKNTGADGNASPGAVVPLGSGLTPTGEPGPQGATGASGLGAVGAAGAAGGSLSGTSYGAATAPTLPSFSVTVGSSGKVIVLVSWQLFRASSNNSTFASVQLSGANTLAASDSNSIEQSNPTGGNEYTASGAVPLSGLNAGATTFTMLMRSDGGAAFTISNPSMVVIPL